MRLIIEDFEKTVRARLGINEADFTDEEISDLRVVELTEIVVEERVPDYIDVTDNKDVFYLQEAAINFISHLLCPTLKRKLNIKVTAADIRWEKDKVDWDARAQQLLNDFEDNLDKLTTVEVLDDSIISATIASTITRDRDPIGGEG